MWGARSSQLTGDKNIYDPLKHAADVYAFLHSGPANSPTIYATQSMPVTYMWATMSGPANRIEVYVSSVQPTYMWPHMSVQPQDKIRADLHNLAS